MYVVAVPNRGSPPAILLRESYREDGKVKNRTVANLTHWPPEVVEGLKILLKGGKAVATPEEIFEKVEDRHHGHVQAVLTAMQRLGLANILASQPSRERNLVLAMIAARILDPGSKLATTRWWKVTTLPEVLGVADAKEDDLYAALDWLIERQDRIERKLVKRHLDEDSLVLYDLTSTYVEGSHCPLAELGYSRDRKRGKLQINFGLLTDSRGCPVSTTVYPGSTGDPATMLEQVEYLQGLFGLKRIALVGDRGMISQRQVDVFKEKDGIDWITALKTPQIRSLLEQRYIQLGLFDEQNLFEFTHPDYPGERLIACRNPELAKLRAHKRHDLLAATTRELAKIQAMAKRGALKGQGEIGVRIGRIINQYKVAKHFHLEIADDSFTFRILDDQVAAEAALDGIYVIRTSLPDTRLDTADTVRTYKLLAQVERAFRSLKMMDLKVRPIYHYTEDRVRAHIFLCMLAYYVEWHMREAWRELLFTDEDQEAKATRDPVAPAKRSEAAIAKVQSRILDDGTAVHSFQTLLNDLSGIVKSTCRRKGDTGKNLTFETVTELNETRRRALNLLEKIAL